MSVLAFRPPARYPVVAAWFLAHGSDEIGFKQRQLAAATDSGKLQIHNALRYMQRVGAVEEVKAKRGPGGGSVYRIVDRDILKNLSVRVIPNCPTGSGTAQVGEPDTMGNRSKPPFHIRDKEQLRTPEGIREIYEMGCAAGYIETSESMWTWLCAVVAKAWRKAYDPVKFVAAFVRRKLFGHVGCRDEDAGRKLVAPPQGRCEAPADDRVAGLVEMVLQRVHRPFVDVAKPTLVTPPKVDVGAMEEAEWWRARGQIALLQARQQIAAERAAAKARLA